MTQRPANALPRQDHRQPQGIPVRSHLRAGIVLQADIPSVAAIQQESQTPVAAIVTTTTS